VQLTFSASAADKSTAATKKSLTILTANISALTFCTVFFFWFLVF